jgi:dienelactone hydrolase
LHLLCRLFADQLAQQGFFVLLPDIFHGSAWDDKVEVAPNGDWSQFVAWKDKHPQGPQLLQLDRLLTDMHQQYKPKSVSCIGFCWGGHHSVTLAGSDKVQAAIVAHGSLVTKELVQGAKQPIQFLFADNVSRSTASI